jgi:hypothetical protein
VIDNETFVHRTEATGGALVLVFNESHAGRKVFRVVCEVHGDVYTTRAEQDSLEAAAGKAGFHAGLCTQTPQRTLVNA